MAVAEPTYGDVNRDVLHTLDTPGPLYFAWITIAAVLLFCFVMGLTWQIAMGLGVTGLRTPQFWALYITDFVFWIGIGHAGTLISAILYLFRARWRTSIFRAAEAMTIFAVMTAGLFPLIHVGRLWFVYFLFPYPNQRGLWPNFKSPLLWDVFAVSTYLSISTVFFIVGLIPDVAALRDSTTGWRHRIYGLLALGWTGSDPQWRHFRRAYGLLAALATPLVLSVHSVVSWDFAMALVPGWHSTLFAPFFVDGAILSGFAMVLVLVLPMRRFFRLYPYITARHLDALARLLLVTSLVLTYFYACDAFTAWYSGDVFERGSLFWRHTGTYAPLVITQYLCNSVVPLALFWGRARRHPVTLFGISTAVLIGMWLERFNIIVPSLGHDFSPYTWGVFVPAIVDSTLTIGSFGFFFLLFLGFIRLMPSVSIAEVKETLPPPMSVSPRHVA
jgi:molybdopterin-containing oxidoreductase family membrane subunit